MGKYEQEFYCRVNDFVYDHRQDPLGYGRLLIDADAEIESLEKQVAQLQRDKTYLKSAVETSIDVHKLEVENLQREKAELEAENSRMTKSLLDLGNHNIFNREIENKYNALVERVKAHNAEILAMCENNPKCVKKKGYRNIRCLDCPKENLIDLDTVVGVE